MARRLKYEIRLSAGATNYEMRFTGERCQRFVVRMATSGGDQRERTADGVQCAAGARPVRVHQGVALGRIVVEQANDQIVHDDDTAAAAVGRRRGRCVYRCGCRVHRWTAHCRRPTARLRQSCCGGPSSGGAYVIVIDCTGTDVEA